MKAIHGQLIDTVIDQELTNSKWNGNKKSSISMRILNDSHPLENTTSYLDFNKMFTAQGMDEYLVFDFVYRSQKNRRIVFSTETFDGVRTVRGMYKNKIEFRKLNIFRLEQFKVVYGSLNKINAETPIPFLVKIGVE